MGIGRSLLNKHKLTTTTTTTTTKTHAICLLLDMIFALRRAPRRYSRNLIPWWGGATSKPFT